MNKEETPFDGFDIPQTPQDFYLLRIISWAWTKTENLSKEGVSSFYDYSPGGSLVAGEADCPLCGGNGSVTVVAGYDDKCKCDIRDWCCLVCGVGGSPEGGYGELIPLSSEGYESHFSLHEYIVVKVDPVTQ